MLGVAARCYAVTWPSYILLRRRSKTLNGGFKAPPVFDKIALVRVGAAGSNYAVLTLKERDLEIGLDYFLARYYSSTQGRFTSLAKAGADEVFVTAADDIAGLSAEQLGPRLGIASSKSFTVIEFPTPANGLASPVFRTNPGFVGFGRTVGGAREFVIPNGPIPANAVNKDSTMIKLKPEERDLIGKWEFVDGKVIGDATTARIDALVEKELEKVGNDPTGWDTLYR